MTTAHSATRRTGYTLLEILVYVAVFGMGLNLFVSALGTGSRLTALTTLQLGRIEGVRDIQNLFVSQVRLAESVVPRVGDFETGDQIVVLRMPPSQSEGVDYVVLGAARDVDHFSMVRVTDTNGSLSAAMGKTLRQPLGHLRFTVHEPTGSTPITLSIQVKQEDGERDKPFLTHETIATPRGMTP